jgi:hypothetical protein
VSVDLRFMSSCLQLRFIFNKVIQHVGCQNHTHECEKHMQHAKIMDRVWKSVVQPLVKTQSRFFGSLILILVCYTQRFKIQLVRVKITLLRVKITILRVKIILLNVLITLIRVITHNNTHTCVKITVCV